MSRFDDCLKFVLAREGGYVCRSEDRGGATNQGITQTTYDEWRAMRRFSPQAVCDIGDDEVADIYRQRYWDQCSCDRLPVPLDLVVFDGAVNHGPRQAAKFLQRSLAINTDGMIGPMTVKAAQADAANGLVPHLVSDILDQRRSFYDQMVARDSSQQVFLKGWCNRLHELQIATEVPA